MNPVNIEPALIEALDALDMSSQGSGLRWTENRKSEDDPYVYLGLEQAFVHGAVAVYFRFFDDGRPPKPQVYIYSSSQLGHSETGAIVHHRLWNSGVVPFFFIIEASQILVYNCGIKPVTGADGESFITDRHELISLLASSSEALTQFSARQFDSGLFWDSDIAKSYKFENSAYEQLLSQLKSHKRRLLTESGEEHAPLVKRVIVMLVLIKYLEDRKDEDGNAALDPNDFYSSFCKGKKPSLINVLSSHNAFIGVLDLLSTKDHFNGQIFKLTSDEKKALRTIKLKPFALFVEGRTIQYENPSDGQGQMLMWKLYSFNYLPIELISHIYEDFLVADTGKIKDDGVVYTPPYLVQFLIDQCMPLRKPKKDFKVLDPACGSGIFLVGAFKRILQWWRIENNWKTPDRDDIPTLIKLLRQSIYGCDISGEAVLLSYFSLSLALLDALSPREIWKKVHFDNLIDRNLFVGDFFERLQEGDLPTDFDLVIGNPPFKSEFSKFALAVNKKQRELDDERPRISYNQISLLFLEQSFGLLKSEGRTCFLLPAGPLLYNTKKEVHQFKRHLFGNKHFESVFDFIALRTKLFNSAAPPVIAVVARNTLPTHQDLVNHVIFRWTRSAGEKIEFEIDHYDIHRTRYQDALDKAWIWQANFFGGGRLSVLRDKLDGFRSINEYLEDKKANNGWVFGEGWQECPNSEPLKRIAHLEKQSSKTSKEEKELSVLIDRHSASWITGKKMIEASGFEENRLEEIGTCNKELFQFPRNTQKEIFSPPHIIIKESTKYNRIHAVFSDAHLTFKDSFFGIHAPKEDAKELKHLYEFLCAEINVALIWLVSGKAITFREGTPLMVDIRNLPYFKTGIEFDYIEKVLLDDVVSNQVDFRKKGERSIVLEPVNEEDLSQFGFYFCQILNHVHKSFRPAEPIVGKEFVCFPFIYGENAEVNLPDTIHDIEKHLGQLIDHHDSHSLWIKRNVRMYEKNVIFMYKPIQKRYWSRSIAIRDADETFQDLFEQGK